MQNLGAFFFFLYATVTYEAVHMYFDADVAFGWTDKS